MNLAERDPARKSDYVRTSQRFTHWGDKDGRILKIGRKKGEVTVALKIILKGTNSVANVGKAEKVEVLTSDRPEIAFWMDFPYCMDDEFEIDFSAAALGASSHKLLIIETIVKCTE